MNAGFMNLSQVIVISYQLTFYAKKKSERLKISANYNMTEEPTQIIPFNVVLRYIE